MEIPESEQEEGDGEEQEDAPHGLRQPEADDPKHAGKHAPEEQDESSGNRWRSFEPTGADAPLQQGEPPPKHAVGGEGDHAEGVAGLELADARHQLGEASEGKGKRHYRGYGLG